MCPNGGNILAFAWKGEENHKRITYVQAPEYNSRALPLHQLHGGFSVMSSLTEERDGAKSGSL
jgi:hypothetical protein